MIDHVSIHAARPGLRPRYSMPFYGAFAFDPDELRIEAVYRAPERRAAN